MNDIFFGLTGLIVGLAIGYLAFRSMGRKRSDSASERLVSPGAAPTGRADQVIANLSEGVILLDALLRPILVNEAARRMLGVQDAALPPRLPSEEVIAVANRALAGGGPIEELITVWFPSRARLQCRATRMEDGVLVLLADVSHEILAQEVRREFVAHASHELKSPVAGLQTLAEAVREAAHDDPAAVARFSDRLVTEATRLGRLVSDLLDLSRLEDAGQVPTALVDISEVVSKQLEQVEAGAAAKGQELHVDTERNLTVRGDAQQLGLMVRNLLENAVRYTPEGGSVTVEARTDGDQALVSVSDTGIGIPLEAQARVFERFYRVDRARSRDRGGTGLGLAIVKHVVELHGGRIALRSELGSGSSFIVSLPLAGVTNDLRAVAG